MHNRRSKITNLSSIPERNEIEEDQRTRKWVPKKKHEVLKAKYKCLKKLFQIYDASVIGILPDPAHECAETLTETCENDNAKRKKRSHRTKTDACAGTTDNSVGDLTVSDKPVIASALLRDLNIQCSCSTQMESQNSLKLDQKDNNSSVTSSSGDQNSEPETARSDTTIKHNMQPDYSYLHSLPPFVFEKRKPTRFQTFISRIFGIKRERSNRNYELPNGHIYAASDNNFNDRRRRRGLRFRRHKRPKKVNSETALRDLRSPMLLNYVQSVQKHCLMDTTQRQCPIAGCCTMLYGIINYNDHLNISHFADRKHVCHYCHEGFQTEYEKFSHENEHLGISKLNNINILSATSTRNSGKKASNTQTDPEMHGDIPEEKLKKIVSFFDKIEDTSQVLEEMKKNRYSESNLQRTQYSKVTCEPANSSITSSTDKRTTMSCGNLMHRKLDKSKSTLDNSDTSSRCPCTPVKCRICGECFDFRRQLSLHMDLEHRSHDKFSKFHSCVGLPSPQTTNMAALPGNIKVQTIKQPQAPASVHSGDSALTLRRSEVTLPYDPSTNIIYYESSDSVMKKPSVMTNFVDKVRNGANRYKWEPGTKIIRV